MNSSIRCGGMGSIAADRDVRMVACPKAHSAGIYTQTESQASPQHIGRCNDESSITVSILSYEVDQRMLCIGGEHER